MGNDPISRDEYERRQEEMARNIARVESDLKGDVTALSLDVKQLSLDVKQLSNSVLTLSISNRANAWKLLATNLITLAVGIGAGYFVHVLSTAH